MIGKSAISQTEGHYVKLPDKLLSLSPNAVALYCYLASQADNYNPALRVAARALNVSVPTIRKAYTELETHGTIKCIHKGFKSVTKKYEFVPISKWNANTVGRPSDTRSQDL